MKKILTLLVCLPLVSFSQSITDSLLLYYNMNGNAQDLSGRNFHGTASGVTPTQDRYGNDSSAYYFDGVNDYIDFPLNDTLKPEFPITFSFWIKLDVLGQNENKFFSTDFVQNNYHGSWMTVDINGELRIGYGGGLGGCSAQNSIAYKATEFPLDTGIWYHVAGVIRSYNSMDLYINCINVAASFVLGTNTFNIGYSNTEQGTLGRIDNNTSLPPRYYKGCMDEFMMWNRELSATEIGLLCDSMPIITDTITNNTGPGTFIGEIPTNKNLLKITNILGQETPFRKNTPLFYIYEDGTVEKKILVE